MEIKQFWGISYLDWGSGWIADANARRFAFKINRLKILGSLGGRETYTDGCSFRNPHALCRGKEEKMIRKTWFFFILFIISGSVGQGKCAFRGKGIKFFFFLFFSFEKSGSTPPLIEVDSCSAILELKKMGRDYHL